MYCARLEQSCRNELEAGRCNFTQFCLQILEGISAFAIKLFLTEGVLKNIYVKSPVFNIFVKQWVNASYVK